MEYRLYSFWRSSCSWRVRIAMNYKKIPYELVSVRLARVGGEQDDIGYRKRNPMGQVPLLEWEVDGQVRQVAQSMAILEYLEDVRPDPPLLPEDLWLRAKTRQLAEIVNSGIQPLQNMSLTAAVEEFGASGPEWRELVIRRGLAALERSALETAGRFLIGDQVTLADVMAVPQLYNAQLYGVDIEDFPVIARAAASCGEIQAFEEARPEAQPEADLS